MVWPALAGAAASCPNCKDALADEASVEGTAARAFSISVIAMLSVLGLVAFALIRVMVIACREADALSAARIGPPTESGPGDGSPCSDPETSDSRVADHAASGK
jgi:hypothetical protein